MIRGFVFLGVAGDAHGRRDPFASGASCKKAGEEEAGGEFHEVNRE